MTEVFSAGRIDPATLDAQKKAALTEALYAVHRTVDDGLDQEAFDHDAVNSRAQGGLEHPRDAARAAFLRMTWNPCVRFYVAPNPTFGGGDGLLTLIPVTLANAVLSPFGVGFQAFRKKLRSWRAGKLRWQGRSRNGPAGGARRQEKGTAASRACTDSTCRMPARPICWSRQRLPGRRGKPRGIRAIYSEGTPHKKKDTMPWRFI